MRITHCDYHAKMIMNTRQAIGETAMLTPVNAITYDISVYNTL